MVFQAPDASCRADIFFRLIVSNFREVDAWGSYWLPGKDFWKTYDQHPKLKQATVLTDDGRKYPRTFISDQHTQGSKTLSPVGDGQTHLKTKLSCRLGRSQSNFGIMRNITPDRAPSY